MRIPMSRHLGIFTVEPTAEGHTVLTWRQYWRKGFMGRVAAPHMKRKYMVPALEGLVARWGGERIK